MNEDDNSDEIDRMALAIMRAISSNDDPEDFQVDVETALEALATVAGLLMAPLGREWQEDMGPEFVAAVRESMEIAVAHIGAPAAVQ